MDITKFFKEAFTRAVLEVTRVVPGCRFTEIQSTHQNFFNAKAFDILSAITRMKRYLLSHRDAYFCRDQIMYGFSPAADTERDQVDRLVEQFARNTKKILNHLLQHPDVRRDAKRQFFAHYEIMLHSLREYLRTVCRIYAEMKAMHIRNICSGHQWSRFGTQHFGDIAPNTTTASQFLQKFYQLRPFSNVASRVASAACWFQQPASDEGTLRLTKSETVQFERENRLLFDRLNRAERPARRIEAQVVGISWLQQILLNRILEQSRRADNALGALRPAVLQVAAASNELRLGGTAKVSTNNRIAFCIFLLSFSLIFLHWYNP
ncbi:unnamed protein product [Ixodes pacificus]